MEPFHLTARVEPFHGFMPGNIPNGMGRFGTPRSLRQVVIVQGGEIFHSQPFLPSRLTGSDVKGLHLLARERGMRGKDSRRNRRHSRRCEGRGRSGSRDFQRSGSATRREIHRHLARVGFRLRRGKIHAHRAFFAGFDQTTKFPLEPLGKRDSRDIQGRVARVAKQESAGGLFARGH